MYNIAKQLLKSGDPYTELSYLSFFDMKNMKVKKREIAEMLFIKKYSNTINLQKDTEN